MFAWSIRYRIVQRFSVPAKAAFEWCTAYHVDDLKLMGVPGTRRITKVADDTVILTDTYENDGKPFVKRKLVRLDRDRLWWSATYLAGPNRYSQFLYTISAKGAAASVLEFDGLQLNYAKTKATRKQIASLEEKVRREDSNSWRLLARSMENDLGR